MPSSQEENVTHPRAAKSPTRRRVSIFISALATVAAGVLVAVVPSTAAQAGPVSVPYCEEHRLPDGRWLIQCWHFDELWQRIRPTPNPCLSCPPDVVQFRWDIDFPDIDVSWVAADVLDGLRGVLAASVATDPKERDADRADALKKYSTAAGRLDKASLKVGEIWRNYKDGYGDPEPQPNRGLYEQYGNETIAGLGLLRAAAADPANAPQLQLDAMGAFDRAAEAFTKAIQL